MHKRKISRSVVLIVLFSVLFLALIARLFYLQIVRGEDYAENFKLRIKREITLPGARGTIYDRNGRPLAVNQLAWSVTVEDQEEYRSERDLQIHQCSIRLLVINFWSLPEMPTKRLSADTSRSFWPIRSRA